MKLTREELREGLDFVLNQNWPAFRSWMEERKMPEKAIKMFRAGFEGMAPEATNAKKRLLTIAVWAGVALSVLTSCGMLAALVKFVFWM